MNRRVCVRGIILKDGKIFAVKQNNSVGQKVDYWCTPGGGLDEGEPILDGLKREIIEETGINPVIGKLLILQQFISPRGNEQLELFFEITNTEDFNDIDLTKTSHGEIELLEYGFVDPKTTYLMPKILSEVELDKIDQPVLINELN